MDELTEENNEIYDKFYELEKYICDIDQYSRRNNVEFRNIPESTGNHDNEKHIIKVLGSIGVVVESYDIVAIHRLGKTTTNKNRSVIVRFLKRRHAYSCLKNSKKLSLSSNPSMKKNIYNRELLSFQQKPFQLCMVFQRHRLLQVIRRYKRTPNKGSTCRGGGRLPRGDGTILEQIIYCNYFFSLFI